MRALEAVGALSSGEALSWLDRLNARLGLSSVKEEEELERQRTCTGLELHRVVEGTTGGDGALRITHVELYADGAMLYWHAAAPDERPEDRPPTLEPPLAGERWRGAWQQEQSRLTVHDDLGTVYECRQGRHAHATALMPSIPASASRLKVSYGDRRLEIPLD